MAALPHAHDFPHEILLHRSQCIGYSRAFEATGARLIDFGHNDRATGAGMRGSEPWETEAAITDRTAAIAFSATPDNGADLELVARICGAKGVPVIVDAAAQLPPKSNLRASSNSVPTSSLSPAARRSVVRRPRAFLRTAVITWVQRSCSRSTWIRSRELGTA